MAAACIDEAVRQIVSVGGDADRIAILDNFCWGNPDKPDRLGGLVRAAEGCYKGAVGYQVPFISGKDSLYNEFTEGKKSIAIPGTILISAIGIMEDATKAVTMDFKEAGNAIYLVGETKDELGGSIYLDTLGQLGNTVPQVNFKTGAKIFKALNRATKSGLVRSCHDCSEGGLAVAVSEMAFSGGLGADIDLRKVKYSGKSKRDDVILFSESATRFVVEVELGNTKKFEALLKGLPAKRIGQVMSNRSLMVVGLKGKVSLQSDINELKEAWQKPLRWG
jgi:phosphoribosylformylglycinamidine synthase